MKLVKNLEQNRKEKRGGRHVVCHPWRCHPRRVYVVRVLVGFSLKRTTQQSSTSSACRPCFCDVTLTPNDVVSSGFLPNHHRPNCSSVIFCRFSITIFFLHFSTVALLQFPLNFHSFSSRLRWVCYKMPLFFFIFCLCS